MELQELLQALPTKAERVPYRPSGRTALQRPTGSLAGSAISIIQVDNREIITDDLGTAGDFIGVPSKTPTLMTQ